MSSLREDRKEYDNSVCLPDYTDAGRSSFTSVTKTTTPGVRYPGCYKAPFEQACPSTVNYPRVELEMSKAGYESCNKSLLFGMVHRTVNETDCLRSIG